MQVKLKGVLQGAVALLMVQAQRRVRAAEPAAT
jgi:hypothetical protein